MSIAYKKEQVMMRWIFVNVDVNEKLFSRKKVYEGFIAKNGDKTSVRKQYPS